MIERDQNEDETKQKMWECERPHNLPKKKLEIIHMNEKNDERKFGLVENGMTADGEAAETINGIARELEWDRKKIEPSWNWFERQTPLRMQG